MEVEDKKLYAFPLTYNSSPAQIHFAVFMDDVQSPEVTVSAPGEIAGLMEREWLKAIGDAS